MALSTSITYTLAGLEVHLGDQQLAMWPEVEKRGATRSVRSFALTISRMMLV